jgi:hypothetical protein
VRSAFATADQNDGDALRSELSNNLDHNQPCDQGLRSGWRLKSVVEQRYKGAIRRGGRSVPEQKGLVPLIC